MIVDFICAHGTIAYKSLCVRLCVDKCAVTSVSHYMKADENPKKFLFFCCCSRSRCDCWAIVRMVHIFLWCDSIHRYFEICTAVASITWFVVLPLNCQWFTVSRTHGISVREKQGERDSEKNIERCLLQLMTKYLKRKPTNWRVKIRRTNTTDDKNTKTLVSFFISCIGLTTMGTRRDANRFCYL